MATLLGRYDAPGLRVSTYEFRVGTPRVGFTATSAESVETYMEGEYTDLRSRLRVDPMLGMVLSSLGWKKLPCPPEL